MQTDAIDQVMQVVRDLRPQLDHAGFHVNSVRGPSETGRLTIAYDESTDVPDALIEAIARVTQTGVDFVHAQTIAIANLDHDHPHRDQPWRARQTIEQLLSRRDR